MKYGLFLLALISSFNAHSLVEKTIHVEKRSNGRGAWSEFTSSSELNFKKLFELLAYSETGEKLIREAQVKAARMGNTLLDVVKEGETSLTDTTLVRKFSPHSPEHVIYESRSVVYISRHLSWNDALLDLAHELTHFVYRGGFNPYSDSFNAKDFIKSTIEGDGGEVQAFMTECRVLKELFSSRVQSRSHCQKIEDESGRPSFTKAISLFYHVGPYYNSFNEQMEKRSLGGVFTELKPEKINFISSAYGVPYPVAALMEFDLVLNKVCENDKKRLAYMQQGPRRTPASESVQQEKFQATYSQRCPQK